MNNTDAEGRLVLGDGVSSTNDVVIVWLMYSDIFIEASDSVLIDFTNSTTYYIWFIRCFLLSFLVLFSAQVAYANKDLHAQVIVDLATLTGAQGAATGKFIRNIHNS